MNRKYIITLIDVEADRKGRTRKMLNSGGLKEIKNIELVTCYFCKSNREELVTCYFCNASLARSTYECWSMSVCAYIINNLNREKKW